MNGTVPRWDTVDYESVSTIWNEQAKLIRIEQEIDANLEAAEIQRRVYQAGGPALFFANVRDCRFPMVSNLFGTLERTRYIFSRCPVSSQSPGRIKSRSVPILETSLPLS